MAANTAGTSAFSRLGTLAKCRVRPSSPVRPGGPEIPTGLLQANRRLAGLGGGELEGAQPKRCRPTMPGHSLTSSSAATRFRFALWAGPRGRSTHRCRRNDIPAPVALLQASSRKRRNPKRYRLFKHLAEVEVAPPGSTKARVSVFFRIGKPADAGCSAGPPNSRSLIHRNTPPWRRHTVQVWNDP